MVVSKNFISKYISTYGYIILQVSKNYIKDTVNFSQDIKLNAKFLFTNWLVYISFLVCNKALVTSLLWYCIESSANYYVKAFYLNNWYSDSNCI